MTKAVQSECSNKLEPRPLRFVVLIDAENVSASVADKLFEEIAKLGEACVRQVHGCFSDGHLNGWSGAIDKYQLERCHVDRNISGKSNSDMSLAVGATNLLHSGLYDGFCIVSSDTDFTILAQNIRDHGLVAYGFGDKYPHDSLLRAYQNFYQLEKSNLVTSKIADETNRARRILKRAIAKFDAHDGWVSLSILGRQLAGFDYGECGANSLKSLVEKAGIFEIKMRKTHKNSEWCIR